MTTVSNAFIALITVACATVLTMGICPGVLNDLMFDVFLYSLFVIPFMVVAGVVALVVLAQKGKPLRIRLQWRQAAILLALLFGTYILLEFYVPCRIAFAVSREAFEQTIPLATLSTYGGVALNRQLGVFTVDEFASDARGGVYFRVHDGGAGFGPDIMSYGFVYKPNQNGTPFGSAGYCVFPLGDDWYWFKVSDDC